MIRLKSRTQCPPNGFLYTQKETGWKSWVAVPQSKWDFNLCALSIQRHRQKNPDIAKKNDLSLDLNTIMNELDSTNALRVLGMRGGEAYIRSDSAFPKSKALSGAPGSAATGLKKYITNTVSGAELWVEWFGDKGMPVDKEKATARASTCMSCPFHIAGDFKQRWNERIAKEIMSVMAMMNDLDLHTVHDKDLKVCDPCDCPMVAKVWVPIGMIARHMKHDVFNSLWEKCWIRTEVAAPTQSAVPGNAPQ